MPSPLRDVPASQPPAPSAAFHESDLLLRTLIMASPLAIYFLDLELRVQLWNPAAERIFGWRAQEVIGRPNPTIPPERWPEAAALLGTILRGEAVTETVVRRVRKDGSVLEVGLSAARLCDPAGHPQGVMAIVADITDRRRLEEERLELLERERVARAQAEAAERRARLLAGASTLLDASLDYHTTLTNLARFVVPELADFCLIDELDGGMLSRVAAAHRDRRREEFLLRRERHPLAGDPERHPVVRVLSEGKSVLVEEVTPGVLDVVGQDPEHRRRLEALELRSFVVVPLIARGRTLGAMSLVSAESGRRFGPAELELAEELAHRAALAIDTARLYHQARQAVRARERVLAVVSHDLRNSLATVLLNASTLLETRAMLPPASSARDPLEWIARSAEQMSRLIHDLLDVSTIDAGRLAIDPHQHHPGSLVREAVEMVRPLLAEKGVRCAVEVVPGLPPVRADGQRIQQVLLNLLGNAVKFTPAGGEIAVRADRGEGSEVRVCVSDSGPGIAEEHRDSIFDYFWQGRHGRGVGAGLGLAIARGIVEAHGGRIWLRDQPPPGSTFCFTIPID